MKKIRTHKLLARLAGGVDNRLNPIMAKEMYQSVHSRAFMVSFWLLTGVALAIYARAWVAQRDEIGSSMFIGFYYLMQLVGSLLLPLEVFFGLLREIATRTLELVQITNIGARRLVRGRLLAVAARLMLLCSMLAPFAILSYRFGGIGVGQIAAAVYSVILSSLLMCALGVWFGSLAVYPRLGQISRFAFPLLLIARLGVESGGMRFLHGSGPGYGLIYLYYFLSPNMPFGSGGKAYAMVFYLIQSTTRSTLLIMLLLAAAANALTFVQNRSSARTKSLMLLLILTPVLFHILNTLLPGRSGFSGELCVITCLRACVILIPCVLVWMTADPSSQRGQPGSKPVTRRARFRRMFRDGPTPTIGYLALAMLPLLVLAVLSLGHPGSAPGGGIFTVMAMYRGGSTSPTSSTSGFATMLGIIAVTITYALYLTAIARIITQRLPLKRRTPGMRRVVLLMFLLLNALLMLPFLMATSGSVYSVASIPGAVAALFPLIYAARVGTHYGSNFNGILLHMALPALFGVVYYIRLAKRTAHPHQEQERNTVFERIEAER